MTWNIRPEVINGLIFGGAIIMFWAVEKAFREAGNMFESVSEYFDVQTEYVKKMMEADFPEPITEPQLDDEDEEVALDLDEPYIGVPSGCRFHSSPDLAEPARIKVPAIPIPTDKLPEENGPEKE